MLQNNQYCADLLNDLKLLYFHQYFKRPEEGGSLRSYYLASKLVEVGHEVVMITAHNHSRRSTRNVNGIQVIYLPVFYSNNLAFGARILSFLKFTILGILESFRHRNVKFCYVMTTPLTTGIIAIFNKFILRRPYIFEVGDLWPAIPIEMGFINLKWQKNILLWMERLCYSMSAGLVGLSKPITKHLQAISPDKPTKTVYNVSDCDFFHPSEKSEEVEEKYQLTNKFVLTYAGTFGVANNLSQIVELAKELEFLPIKFLFVGEGVEKSRVKELVNILEVVNIEIIDQVSRDEIREIINVSDAMLVSFAPYELLHTGSPNKFFDALAAGKLIITNLGGWVKNLIEVEKCGFSFCTSEEFKEEIKPFLGTNERLKAYQQNSRNLASERFSLKLQSERQINFLNQLFS